MPKVVAPSCYNIYSQAVTRVSLRRRSTLQGWWASIYVSMPICVSEGINCCNCYGWSARTFYYNVYALVPAAVKGCCPRAPAVSLLLLRSLRRSPGPTLPLSCLQGCVSYVNRYCWSVLILSLPSKMKPLFRRIVAKLLSM